MEDASFETVRGMKDYTPEDMQVLEFIFSKTRDVFKRYGFVELGTPVLETIELLTAKGGGGEEIKSEIYAFKDKAGREIGLKYDQTVPLARYVASNPNLLLPFKRYQIDRAWRYDRPQAGRYREFWQADIDIVGSSSPEADAEIIAAAIDVYNALGLPPVTIRINNRKILNALAKQAGINTERIPDMLRSIDKLEKIGESGVTAELREKGFKTEEIDSVLDTIQTKGDTETVLNMLDAIIKDEEGREGITELKEIFEILKSIGYSDIVKLDLSIVRGLDYYTGTVFETSVKGYENIGSVGSGGRFDKLIGLISGKDMPATGIGLGVSRIEYILKKEGVIVPKKSPTQAFIAVIKPEFKKYAMKIAKKMRDQNINTEIDLMKRNFRKQLDYANKKQIPFAIIIGEKEQKEGKITLKNLKTGEQQYTEINSAISQIKRAL